MSFERNSAATKKLWANPEYVRKQRSARAITHYTGNPKTLEGLAAKKEKLRLAILKRYEQGWRPKCGRAKKYWYESSIAGKVQLDGQWELKVAKYLDRLGVRWERNIRRFEYINLKGVKANYTPDFWVQDWNTYIEVKGYQTELDQCKWNQFQHPLEIWNRAKLIELKLLEG